MNTFGRWFKSTPAQHRFTVTYKQYGLVMPGPSTLVAFGAKVYGRERRQGQHGANEQTEL